VYGSPAEGGGPGIGIGEADANRNVFCSVTTGVGRTVENNLDSPPGTIDLHGLYVKEGASCQPHTTQ
jgi:hypothetical protein